MEQIRSKVIRGSKDGKGRIRKYVEVPGLYYDDFEFGELVRIEKMKGS